MQVRETPNTHYFIRLFAWLGAIYASFCLFPTFDGISFLSFPAEIGETCDGCFFGW
jgi:hypothetical protein